LPAVSGKTLSILNYEGVAVAEKCSCPRDFFAFSTRPLLSEKFSITALARQLLKGMLKSLY
jgi:hypothetical protein